MKLYPDIDAVEGVVRLPNSLWPPVHIRSTNPEFWTVTLNEMRIDDVHVSVLFDLRAIAKLFQIEIADLSDNACVLWRREIRVNLSDIGFVPGEGWPKEYFKDSSSDGDVHVLEIHQDDKIWFEVSHSWIEDEYDHEGEYDSWHYDLNGPRYSSLIEARDAAATIAKAKKAFLHDEVKKFKRKKTQP